MRLVKEYCFQKLPLLSGPRTLAVRGIHPIAGVIGLLPVLVLLAGYLLGIEPLLHLFPIPKEAVEGQANGIETAGDGGSTGWCIHTARRSPEGRRKTPIGARTPVWTGTPA